MIKTVLFDLDGTLLDTESDFTFILNQLLSDHDHPNVSATQVRETVSDGARALITLGFKIDESNPNFPFLLKNLLSLYAKKINNTACTLFEGIEDLIKRIEQENCQWGIVTNKPSCFTLPLIKNFTSFDSCSVVICPDDVSQAKPDPEGLLLACEKTNSLFSEAIYVGDHLRDIEAGKNAGMKTVAVNWGYFSDNTPIDQWQADVIVDTPLDIQNFLFS